MDDARVRLLDAMSRDEKLKILADARSHRYLKQQLAEIEHLLDSNVSAQMPILTTIPRTTQRSWPGTSPRRVTG